MATPLHLPPRLSAATGRERGFALLVTIVLVAFLVLVLVALATFTRVETQVAANGQSLAQARQNALTALNIALGQTQLMLGPDTRATAPAAQKGDGAPSPAATDPDNNGHWTGVYRQDPAASDHAPRLLTWLVSGNEAARVPAAGGNTPAFTPDAVVSGLAPSMSPVAPVSVGGAPAMLLVGPGSTSAATAAEAASRFVVAPLVDLKVEAAALPGADPSGAPATIGRFAYWIGDESTKAKATLIDPWENPAPATLAAAAPPITPAQAETFRFVNAQRSAIEFFDAAGSRLGSDYPAGSAALARVLALSQLPMANPAASARLGAAVRERFHELTADSFSVLADASDGGLKRDLTAWAAQPAPASPALDDLVVPGAAADTGKYGLPRWGMLHDHLNTRDASGAPVEARPRTATRAGVYPIITYARIAYNITCPGGSYVDEENNKQYQGSKYRLNIMPAIVLWNPCNVPIDKNSELEFCYQYTRFIPGNAAAHDRAMLILFQATPNSSYRFPDAFDLTRVGVTEWSTDSWRRTYGDQANVRQFWRFKVALSRHLAPGESRLFTLHDDFDGTPYESGVSMLTDAHIDPYNAVHLLSHRDIPAAELKTRTHFVMRTEPYVDPQPHPQIQMELLLTKPPPATAVTAANITASLRADAYQTLLGLGFGWRIAETKWQHDLTEADPTEVSVYHRVELAMSTVTPISDRPALLTSTPRWLTNLNPTASTMLRRPSTTLRANPSYLKEAYATSPYNARAPLPVPQNQSGNVSAGTEVSPTPLPPAPQNVVLREFQRSDLPLFSIAQLQHANVSALNLNPAYVIGNSAANIHVPRTATNSGALGSDLFDGFPNGTFNRIYDLSYLLNRALWDGWFCSTIPSGLTANQTQNPAFRLPNARHRFHLPEGATPDAVAGLAAPDTAAAHLLLDGGFNVNSTSLEAWRALLAAHHGVAVDPTDSTRTHAFSRFASPPAGTEPNASAPWMSWRILSDAQIDALATAIVAEVRARGPFLSLSDFVNRRLVADATGLKGALQAAIDATSGAASINGVAPFTGAAMRVTDYPEDLPASDTEQRAIYLGGTDPTAPSSSRAAYAPGFLTQADLLSVIGPQLTARADTLRIRAYGDVMNPVTGSADPEARAWCEAIVQRLPAYVDPQDAPATAPPALAPVNTSFGRRFHIVSFRWLSPDEI